MAKKMKILYLLRRGTLKNGGGCKDGGCIVRHALYIHGTSLNVLQVCGRQGFVWRRHVVGQVEADIARTVGVAASLQEGESFEGTLRLMRFIPVDSPDQDPCKIPNRLNMQ